MTEVIIDFETVSKCSLKESGAARYAEHLTTEVLCVCYRAFGSSERLVFYPGCFDELWDSLWPLVTKGEIFVSHGDFEQYIWQSIMVPRHGFPPLPVERWRDVMAVAAWKSLPLGHEDLGATLQISAQKDTEGSQFTVGLSKTYRKTGDFDRSPETLERVIAYCHRDVDGELQNYLRLGWLSPIEEQIWQLTEKINLRGVKFDMDFVRAAKKIANGAAVPLAEEFAKLTGGLTSGQRDKLLAWCAAEGTILPDMKKETIDAEFGPNEDEEGDEDSLAGDEVSELATPKPPRVRRMIDIRRSLSLASVKKLDRMLVCACNDGRVRGLQQYHGAGTGRFTGRLLQPHNFPWDKQGLLAAFEPELVVETIMSGDFEAVERAFGLPALRVISLSLRQAMIPEAGHVFLVGDYAGIEARIVLALAGQHDKTEMMAAGRDVYLDMAADIYNAPRGSLDKDHDGGKRQVGKNTVLGCGFQMGAKKFRARYCPDQPEAFAERVIDTYRTIWAPKVPMLWDALKGAVNAFVRHGVESQVYGCRFRRAGEWLAIDLPSG
jgi:DNA polymerase bacteriophage-type